MNFRLLSKFSLILLFFIFGKNIILAQSDLISEDSLQSNPEFLFVEDDLIISAIDSLYASKFFSDQENDYRVLGKNKYGFIPNQIPYYHDSVYYYRMQQLNLNSPMNLVYNPTVKQFIDLYAQKKRVTTSRVLGLAQYYFPIFEHMLDKYNLPLELKYLAIVESALNPVAKSRMGAGGLWQFMYNTGKIYGLELTSYVDDRNDPYKATRAACQHFSDLYNLYHDWSLVLAAYNSGAGNVNKAIRRSGGKRDFWEIRPYLPKETRDYVPAFIAVNYIMSYSQEHNIYPVNPKKLYSEIDTVKVKFPLSFDVISKNLNICKEDLEFLNPTFRMGIIPASESKPYTLVLPVNLIGDFITNENTFFAFSKQSNYNNYSQLANSVKTQTINQRINHKVRGGENLSLIANKYNCSVADIKKWNKIKGNKLYKGQYLKVYKTVKVEQPVVAPVSPTNQTQSVLAANTETENTTKVGENKTQSQPTEYKEVTSTIKGKFHKVKKGETLLKIANKHNVSTQNLMKWNALKSSKIYIGQNIRVNPHTKVVKMVAKNSVQDTPDISNQNIDTVGAKYYTVAKGDFLAKIATKYNVSVNDLVEWNNLENTNLAIGDKLRINKPIINNIDLTYQDSTATSISNNLKLVLYKVKPGDTIWSIAKQYQGITVDEIKQWNEMPDYSLQIGQQIRLLLSEK